MESGLNHFPYKLFILLALGYLVGRLTAPERSAAPELSQTTHQDDQCNEIRQMYEKLRKDYISLQDQHSQAVLDASNPAPTLSPSDELVVENTPTALPTITPNHPTAVTLQISEHTNTTEYQQLKTNMRVIERELGTTTTAREKLKFLDKVALKTPLETINAMPGITPQNNFYENLFGKFKGSIQFTIRNRKNGSIILQIRKLEEPINPKDWVIKVDIKDGLGNESRQLGGIDMLRALNDQSRAFYLRASEKSYLQMFYRSSSDQFLGNYYEKDTAGNYPKLGTFWLKRLVD